MSAIETLFGSGKELTVLQMSDRALVVFVISLVLVRLGGMRAFGRRSSFDSVIVIMLGAVLSRAVAGVSPFWPTIAAGTVLVVIHRLLALATARWHWLERLIKGHHHVLYREGTIDWPAMHRAGITRAELDEAARTRVAERTVEGVAEVYVESSGDLTVVRRP